MKQLFYRLLNIARNNRQLNQILQYVYLKLSVVFGMRADSNDRLLFKSPSFGKGSSDKRPRVAFICDEMTWQDFHPYTDAIFLHPKVWRKQLEEFRPDILFCESAWSGIEKYSSVWRGRIYKDRRVSFENRDILLQIVAYCRQQGTQTVFWNKEDPAYFAHPVYDFTDTALHFDYVFTTAAECVDGYRSRGHGHVFLLPFGVNTDMFYPEEKARKENTVMFAGSWFSDHPERCKALEKLLDYAIAQGWKLDIYDRYSHSSESKFRFPEKYASYLRPAVPFSEMPEVYRKYTYAINVNTVVGSPTMISRRILQLAASGITILSNDAQGFRALSDCLDIHPTDEEGIILIEPSVEATQKHASVSRFHFILDSVFSEEAIHA